MTSTPELPRQRTTTRRQAADDWCHQSPCTFDNRRIWSTADSDDIFGNDSVSLNSENTKRHTSPSSSADSAYDDPAYWRRDSMDQTSMEAGFSSLQGEPLNTDTGTGCSEGHKHGRLVRILYRFADRTSMQGVPYIRSSTTLTGKLIWFFLFIACLVFLAGHLFYLFNVYYSYPKQTTVELGFSPLNFPAVTFCNVNALKRSRLEDMSEQLRRLVMETEPDIIIQKMAEQAEYSVSNKQKRKKRSPAANGLGNLLGNAANNPGKSNGRQANNNNNNNNNRGRGGAGPPPFANDKIPLRLAPPGMGNGNGDTSPTTATPEGLEVNMDLLQLLNGPGDDEHGRRSRAATTTQASAIAKPGSGSDALGSPGKEPIDDQSAINRTFGAAEGPPPIAAPLKAKENSDDTEDSIPNRDSSKPNKTDSSSWKNQTKPDKNQEKLDKNQEKHFKNKRKKQIHFVNDLDLRVQFTNCNRLRRLKKQEEDTLAHERPQKERVEELFTEPSVMSNIQSEFMFLYSNTDRTNRTEAGHQVEDMLVDCSFAGRRCHPQNFTLVTSAVFGNCFTIDHPNMLTTRGGYQGGLSLTVFLEGDEYLIGVTQGTGIQVIIHPHGTLPFPQEDGMAIMAGTETNIALRLININRLGLPYGVCQTGEEFQARYGHSYTRRACQHYCEQETIMRRCTCYSKRSGENVHMTVDSRLQPCTTDGELSCMLRVEAEFERGQISCECDNPCTETTYTKTVSMRHWPADEYVGVFVETLCTQRNASDCEKYRSASQRTVAQSFVKINVFYEDLNYENITEVEDYEMAQFASDVGGTVGLWLGLSFLSGFEVLQLLLEISVYFLTFGCCRPAAPKSPTRNNTRLQRRAALRVSNSTETTGFSGY